MSIYPDWIGLDMGTGATTVVDMLEVEMVALVIEIEMEAIVVVDIFNDVIEAEVC